MTTAAIIINKNSEAESMLSGMCNNEFRPSTLPFPEVLASLKDKRYTSDNPRAIFRFHDTEDVSKSVLLQVKIFCLQDLMNKNKKTSSAEEKFKVLPPILERENPDIVIAMGTAYSLSESTSAGSVIVGGRFFIHNGHPGNHESNMQHPDFEKMQSFNINPKVFDIINPLFKQKIEYKFLKPANHSATRPALHSSQFYCALSSANVTDYGEYAWVEGEAYLAFIREVKKFRIGSMETTHSIIRLSSAKPCMFVSAITDRAGNLDIASTAEQNYIASFNAGLVLGQFISDLNDQLKDRTFVIKPE